MNTKGFWIDFQTRSQCDHRSIYRTWCEGSHVKGSFGIGYTRYEKILNKKVDKPSGGRNNAAVSDVMLAQLARFAALGVKTELGYPRRQLRYVTDPACCSAYSVANYEHRILDYMYFQIRSISTF